MKVFSLILCLLVTSSAYGVERLALVIGNSNYVDGPLANPANDATLVGNTLESLGFEVDILVDTNRKAMKRAILHLTRRLEEVGKDSVGVFYFAGHGIQVDGSNYLIPVDAEITREFDVEIEAISADTIVSTIARAQNRINFFILDACRNNPLIREFRSPVRGLASMEAPSGTMIAYATSPGGVAVDGSGDNSPYTDALARFMVQPGIPVEKMFRLVRNKVVAETNRLQIPWESSSLIGGDFYFNTNFAAEEASLRAEMDRVIAELKEEHEKELERIKESIRKEITESELSECEQAITEAQEEIREQLKAEYESRLADLNNDNADIESGEQSSIQVTKAVKQPELPKGGTITGKEGMYGEWATICDDLAFKSRLRIGPRFVYFMYGQLELDRWHSYDLEFNGRFIDLRAPQGKAARFMINNDGSLTIMQHTKLDDAQKLCGSELHNDMSAVCKSFEDSYRIGRPLYLCKELIQIEIETELKQPVKEVRKVGRNF